MSNDPQLLIFFVRKNPKSINFISGRFVVVNIPSRALEKEAVKAVKMRLAKEGFVYKRHKLLPENRYVSVDFVYNGGDDYI